MRNGPKLATAVFVVLATLTAVAQQQITMPDAPPEFEVASVRALGRVMGQPIRRIAHGKAELLSVTLDQAVAFAYGVQLVQVVGGPDWTRMERFAILAKAASGEVTPRQVRRMLQALLAQRFQLRVHTETKELPLHTLTVSKNGSKLRESTANADQGDSASPSRSGMTFENVDIESWSYKLSNLVGTPVVNLTGLTGRFDIRLDIYDIARAEPNWDVALTSPDGMASILAVALRRLGLQLDRGKGPTDVWVIDHVEPPSDN